MSIVDFFVNVFNDAASFAAKDPGAAAFYAIAGTTFVFFIAPIVVDGIILPMIGFGSMGIVKGSLAAAWQSSIGNVVTPSVFSTIQSAAMGGYGIQAVHAVVFSTAFLSTLGAAGAALFAVKNSGQGEDTWEFVGKEDAEKAAASGQAVLNVTSDASSFTSNTIRQILEAEGNQEKIQAAQAFVGSKAAEASKLFDGLVDQVGEVYQRPETQEKLRQAGYIAVKVGQDAAAFFQGLAGKIAEIAQRPENKEKLEQAGEFASKVSQDAAAALHAISSWFGWRG